VLMDAELRSDPSCKNNETRVENRAYVDEKIAARLSDLTYEEIDYRFSQADLAFAPLMEIENLKNHPDLRTYTAIADSSRFELPVTPGNDYASLQEVPRLGEHTREVLESLE
ncbi:MAG: hypothetical protein CBE21_06275, partial [Proteobacteria bacterium TMED261]